MNSEPFEKHVNYGGIETHIRIPESPTGLVFIAPGNEVDPNDPLIQAIKQACEAKGEATVIADLSKVELIMDNPNNVNNNFTDALRQVIDGYMSDNEYAPDEFKLIGHSAGAAAVLTLAGESYPIPSITVLDPISLNSETLKAIECPTDLIASSMRSYKAAGRRMFNTLKENGVAANFHEIKTSNDLEGHRFVRATDDVAEIIREQGVGPSQPDISPPDETFDAPEQ